MGSLNLDGSIIQRQNETYRNVGGAIRVTQQALPNITVTLTEENSVPFPSGASRADLTTSQWTTQLISPTVKVTDSATDSLVSRNTNRFIVSASGNPEIGLIPVRDYSDRHTGDKIVLGDSSIDEVVSRRPNTNFRP
jgi:hypothetical protein